MTERRSLLRSIRLADWRLRASWSWRGAVVAGAALSAFFTLSIVYLAVRGHGASVGNVPARAALWIGWAAGALIAWWNATDRSHADRSEGISALARCHGLNERLLPAARALAAWWRLSLLVGAALLPVAIASIAASPDRGLLIARVGALAVLALFALVTGLVGGAVASLCGAASPRHGRSLLLLIVLLPWAMDGVVTQGRAGAGSLPGLLSAIATMASRLGSGA